MATLVPAFSAETVSVGALEIIDAHGHLNADMPAEKLTDLLRDWDQIRAGKFSITQ
jgi:hypothetical protein